MQKLTGLVAAPFTPFDEQGELALDKIEQLVELYLHNGLAGAFICGTTGEGVSLTLAEKKLLMKQWGQVKRDDFKVMTMLGGTCLKEMQELAEYAAGHDLDGISIVAPYYFRLDSVRQLVNFCKALAATVPEIPFYYYHIPVFSGGYFSMLEFLKEAHGQIPSLAGIKYSQMDIVDFHNCCQFENGKYDLLWGTDEALLSALVVGATGAVGSTYNYAAPLYHNLIQAFREGRLEEARQKQSQAVQMVELLMKYGGIAAGKAFMKMIGVNCGWFRPPFEPMPAEDYHKLEAELRAIGFFGYCSKKSMKDRK